MHENDTGRLFVEGSTVRLEGFARVGSYICFSISPKRVYVLPGPVFGGGPLRAQFCVGEGRCFTDEAMAFFLDMNGISGVRYDWLDGRYVPYGYDRDIILWPDA